MPFAAAAIGVSAVGGIASSLINSSASSNAADKQAQSDANAAAQQQSQFAQTQANLAPYNAAGQANLGLYGNFYKTSADQLGSAFNNAQNAIPGAISQSSLEATPGYQWQLQQGQRAVANSSAAKGLGVSGAALQGAATYASGLANSNYQTQFGNQQTIYQDQSQQYSNKQNQLNTIYNQISAPVSMGENAAATAGNQGVQNATAVGNDLIAGGNAQAAGITGSAAGIGNALTSAANSPLSYLGIQQALGNGSGSNSFTDDFQTPNAAGFANANTFSPGVADAGF
jgi:hypothetical protein